MLVNKKFNNTFLAGIFLIYLIFNGILLARHELWRDEANVWLMARELSPLQLLAEIKYQGHPCLWYLLVMPFAKAGLPFQTIGVISFLVMAVTAALFLWKSPFYTPVKAFAVLSPVFTYFYADIARNYCLIALLLILLAWLYPKRNQNTVLYGALLGLLVQADTITIAAAGMISLMWLCENAMSGWRERTFYPVTNVLKGLWIPLASFFLWCLQFYQVSDSPEFKIRILGIREFLSEAQNFSYGIINRMTGWGTGICLLFLVLVSVSALVVSARIKNGWAFGVMAAAFLFQAVFSAMVYQLHIWHYISLCFTFIWMMWCMQMQAEEKGVFGKMVKGVLALLQMLFLSLCIFMSLHWDSGQEPSNLGNALHGLYSDGVHAAEYIKGNIPKEELIISDNVPMASTVLAYLKDYEFYYAGNGRKESYADWSEEQNRTIGFMELIEWAREKFPDKEYGYLLVSGASCIEDMPRLSESELLYRTEGETARGEEYEIYKVSLQDF